MTQKEIAELKAKEYNRKNWKVYGEGGCRDFILSCLAYGTSKEEFMKKYAQNYLKQTESWIDRETNKRRTHTDGFANTLKEVEDVWDDQVSYFRNHCKIQYGVYTDSEGCSYNSIVEY